ncbi:hypothetical protein HRbin30_01515 [bacterium HR30]|nr:hypothetical protein HRbin30_01515 [bacterium HR30]
MSEFPAIRIEGGLLGPDVLDQLLAADLRDKSRRTLVCPDGAA